MDEKKELETIHFLIPCYKDLPSASFRSIVTLLTHIEHYGFKMNYIIQDGLYIAMGRNVLADTLLKSEPKEDDLVVWIDSDQIFSVVDILDLIVHFKKSKFDMLSGKINVRNPSPIAPLQPMGYMFGPDNRPILAKLDDTQPFTQVDATGFGCLVMRISTLKKMAINLSEKEKLFNTGYIDGVFTGEDVWFFKHAKKLGLTIAIDNKIPIWHYGFSR